MHSAWIKGFQTSWNKSSVCIQYRLIYNWIKYPINLHIPLADTVTTNAVAEVKADELNSSSSSGENEPNDSNQTVIHFNGSNSPAPNVSIDNIHQY